MSSVTAVRASVLLLAAFVLLLLAAGCVRNTPDAPKTPPVTETPLPPLTSDVAAVGFAGDAACAECHPQAFREHQASRHAATLHLATRSSLGKLAPKTGALPGSKARIAQDGDGYTVMMPGGGSGPLQYVLGSGKTGMTFVTLMGSQVMEMRASYFPHQGKWLITPGQNNVASSALGVVHRNEEARTCIQCHTTTLPPDSNVPEKRFFGVGCEACHGPGAAHVAAMKSGKSADIQMERIGTWDAKRVNDLCGTCHRNAETAGMSPGDTPDLSVTARFQPYALMLSRCFKESNNTLSCNTCHSPHQNTSHDVRAYEAACLRCHSGKTAKAETTGGESKNVSSVVSPSAVSKVCPVNPHTGCVGCHMPRKPMIGSVGMSATAPDHFIRVRRPALEAKWAHESQTAPASMSSSPP